MCEIFDRALKELNTDSFDRWVCFAYGVLVSDATESQKVLLEKALEQDKKRDEDWAKK